VTAEPAEGAAPVVPVPLARAPVVAYGGAFAVGVATGLGMLVDDTDTTSSGAGVAVANTVHVVIALVVAAVAASAWRRDPPGLRAWVRTPFTCPGWCRTVDGFLALPVGVAELALLAVGRRGTVARIEAWRDARLGTGPRDLRRLGRRVAAGLPVGVVTLAAALVTFQAVWRAGVQVFAAVDRDFTRDAWGGPTYLGASVAHWMDGVLLFAACSALIALAARRRR
jgi:hypothetical protein